MLKLYAVSAALRCDLLLKGANHCKMCQQKGTFWKLLTCTKNCKTTFTLVLSAEAVCCLCCAPSWPATRRWRQPRQKGCLLHTMYYYNHRARGRRRTVSEFHYFLGYKGVKVRSFLKSCFAQPPIDAILVVPLADFQANLSWHQLKVTPNWVNWRSFFTGSK